MKLYRITFEYDALVAADDEDEAASLGIDCAEEALRDSCDGPDMSVYELTDPAEIPKVWRGCLPYRHRRERGNPELTVEEVLRQSLQIGDKP